MSLREYQKKRDFSLTQEPGARAAAGKSGNMFVVQKHDASRLHYDFRLEMDGVLKSWAVPKGFPWEHSERRLAVQVEDHPIDYAHFEGIIPEGQYGGGTVMVWDTGTYKVFSVDPLTGWKEGKLHMALHGSKLEGEWTLVRSGRDSDEKNWLLIKTAESAKPLSKTRDDQSALTKRTMRQIAAQKTAVWQSNRSESKPTAKPKARAAAKKSSTGETPHWVEPMKAKLVENPPTGKEWLYELKWDGYRALAIKNGGEIDFISRTNKTMTDSFPEIREALSALPDDRLVIDGEICALDTEGRPRFQLLQNRGLPGSRPALYYYAFDLLHRDGKDLRGVPLVKRKSLLEKVLAGAPEAVRFSATLNADVDTVLAEVRKRGLEGLIGKQKQSRYEAGKRSGAWVKIKVSTEQEFVIGGFTKPEGTRKYFGAILVGYYEEGRLRFAGKAGTGFNQESLKRLHGMFVKLKTSGCPFADLPKKSGGRWGQSMTPAEMRLCTFLKPELVCQIKFAEWTEDAILRQPVYIGLREDKDPREVVREVPA